MKTLNPWYHFTFFIISCYVCSFSMLITGSPTLKINETDENHIPEVEVILKNKTTLTRESIELVCDVKPKSAALAIAWIKENKVVLQNQRIKVEKHRIIIHHTMPSDAGYYTCSVRTPFGMRNETAFLTVAEQEEEEEEEEEDVDSAADHSGNSPCGSPERRKVSTCKMSYGYSNCKSFAPAANVDDIKIRQTLKNDVFGYPSISMVVEWKVPKSGNTDIWGWQIMIVDIGRDAGNQACVRINRRFLWESSKGDLFLNFTFNDIDIGTKIKLSIQSLPAMDRTKGLVTKTIFIQDHSDYFPKSTCSYDFKNVTIKQTDQTSVMLSWPDLKNSSINTNILSNFHVSYESFGYLKPDICHDGSIITSVQDTLNKSYITVLDLKPECQNYTFKVTPIFTNSACESNCSFTCDSNKKGRSSKLYFFQMSMNDTADLIHAGAYMNNLFKALVVMVVFLIIAVCLTFAFIIIRKKRGLEKDKEPDTISKERPVTEVFIAHGSHCKDCDDAVLSVATYLNMTGHCKCFLDLCSLPKEWSPGMTQYYENQIAKRQKVIVVFTVNEIGECQENIKARNFIYQKNLIRSELLANCPTTKFVPVYIDFLSDLDIPSFLRNKKSFSLPSQLTELILYIIGEPVWKPVSVCPMLSLEEDSSLLRQKKIVETKIKDLNAKHQKLKNKNNNVLAKIV